MSEKLRFQLQSDLFGNFAGHIATTPPGWSYHDHFHPEFELLYCLKGEVVEWVKDRDYTIRAGDCLLIKPNVRHSTANNAEQPFRFLSLTFHVTNLELKGNLLAMTEIYLPAALCQESGIERNIQDILGLIEGTRSESSTVNRDFDVFEMLVFLSAFMDMMRKWFPIAMKQQERHSSQPIVKESDVALAHAIAKELEESLFSRRLITEIAGSHHVSRSKLSRLFKEVYGISPRQYLTQLHIRHAKELLVHTTQSIESIADRLDFSSVQHFSRQFKSQTGLSPHAFRMQTKTKR